MKKLISIILSVTIFTAVLAGCSSSPKQSSEQNTNSGQGVVQTKAVLPERSYSGDPADFLNSDDYMNLFEENLELRIAAIETAPLLRDFYISTLAPVLDSEDENKVYSPLNLYMALAVLSEIASGETRDQILKLAGISDQKSFQKQAATLWDNNYHDNPLIKSQLANSIWLRDDISYNSDLLNTLASDYFTDSFVGSMGSDSMNEALRQWTDEHTGGLLTEYTEGMSTDPRTVMELISTLYYKTNWTDKFDPSRNTSETFHGSKGDSECEMMHTDYMGAYYFADNFSAVSRGLNESGGMYFVLPDDGMSFKEVLENPQLTDLLVTRGVTDTPTFGSTYGIVHLSVPKFDVSSKTDLTEILKSVGVTDAFNSDKADFSSLTNDIEDPIFISKADHAARVMIDEEGVTGASYVDMALAGAGMQQEEVDFVLDRPFLFFITGTDGSILFAGTVNDLN